MKNQKGSAATWTIILAIIIVAGGVYFYSKNSSTSVQTVSTVATTTQPSITITAPSAGQTYYDNSTMNVSWNSSNYSGLLDVALTSSNGDFVLLACGIEVPNTGTCSWTIPRNIVPDNPLPSALYRINIRTNDDSINTYSPYFTIDASQASTSQISGQTYTNTQYGFSFQYPADYQAKSPDSNLMTLPDKVNVTELYGPPDNILVTYEANSTSGSEPATPSYSNSGLPYSPDDTGTSESVIIWLPHNSSVVLGIADNSPEDASILNGIASTFKLTQ
jgi:hypothetical protein